MQINKYFISYSIAIAICFNLLSYNSFGYFYQNNIGSVNKDTVIDIITNDTTYEEAFSKDSIIKKSLFSFKKSWITTKPIIYDTAALISKRLLEISNNQKDIPVVINADALATHQSVINVMEAARLAGLTKLTFATQIK